MQTQKYSVNQYLIEAVLSSVSSGEIAIPEIQRPFVWNSSNDRLPPNASSIRSSIFLSVSGLMLRNISFITIRFDIDTIQTFYYPSPLTVETRMIISQKGVMLCMKPEPL